MGRQLPQRTHLHPRLDGQAQHHTAGPLPRPSPCHRVSLRNLWRTHQLRAQMARPKMLRRRPHRPHSQRRTPHVREHTASTRRLQQQEACTHRRPHRSTIRLARLNKSSNTSRCTRGSTPIGQVTEGLRALTIALPGLFSVPQGVISNECSKDAVACCGAR